MKVEIFTFCKSATLTITGLDITGAAETFSADNFPSRFEGYYLVYRLRFETGDASRLVQLSLINEDGAVILSRSKQATVELLSNGFLKPNIGVVGLTGVIIPAAGEYSVTLSVGDVALISIPLKCIHREPLPKQGGL